MLILFIPLSTTFSLSNLSFTELNKAFREPIPFSVVSSAASKTAPLITENKKQKPRMTKSQEKHGNNSGLLTGIGSDLLNEYRIMLENKISKNLYIPDLLKRSNLDLSSYLEIEIEHDGNLGNINFLKKSGIDQIDQIVLEAVKNASPFPPVPIAIGKLKVELPLRFKTN